VNNVYELRNTGALIHYLYKALFRPTKAAMLQAVKHGHLITCPGLMEDAINKHLKHCHGPHEPAAPEHTINLDGAN
jgi:hypothetical protein